MAAKKIVPERDAPVINCYPNPFNETLHIEIDNESYMTGNEIKILDMGGNSIRNLPLTSNQASWNGTNTSGTKCKPGIYLVRIGNSPTINKILLTQ